MLRAHNNNKIKFNTVGADASVRLEKNQNKNNIKIFEKFKSDVVGVGVLDDPKEKRKFVNKFMSDNPTSNLKIPTSLKTLSRLVCKFFYPNNL